MEAEINSETKKCLACNGRGFLIFKDGRQEKCSKCHGTGTISKMLILARKEMEKQKKTCPKCHGTGRIKVKDIPNRLVKSEKCPQCKGTGKIKREKNGKENLPGL